MNQKEKTVSRTTPQERDPTKRKVAKGVKKKLPQKKKHAVNKEDVAKKKVTVKKKKTKPADPITVAKKNTAVKEKNAVETVSGGNGNTISTTKIDFELSNKQRDELLALLETQEWGDAQVADLMAMHLRPLLRYVPAWNCSLVFVGKNWVQDGGSSRAQSVVQSWCAQIWKILEPYAKTHGSDQVKQIHRLIRGYNSARGIRELLNLASTNPRWQVELSELNARPNLINLRNGTLDLSTDTFREHRRNDLITQVAAIDFDTERWIDCPRFLQTLRIALNGDKNLIRYVQQLFGYALLGRGDQKILPIAVGAGNNGKTTVVEVIKRILGDYAGTADQRLLLGHGNDHPTGLASLYGKRLVTISEPELGARLRESMVKQLTGRDEISARRMKQDFWTFNNRALLWLSTNHLPKVSGTDDAIWSRLKVIPWSGDIAAAMGGKGLRPRADMIDHLVRTEAPGIFNWILQGCWDYIENGCQFDEPLKIRNATMEYRDSLDEIGRFVRRHCEIRSNATIESEGLFRAFQDAGGTISSSRFVPAILERYNLKKMRVKRSGYRPTIIIGLHLREQLHLW